MPRIEMLRVCGLHVAFSMNDWGQIHDVAVGLWGNHARVRCLRKHDKRVNLRA